ncbi:MAG: ASCH domain-containing protein [Nocardiaceae bacterium]|nr:ASCH domain-containing protein [Nocardiaceae bacterium]
MLISKPIAEAIREGRVTAQFRRWDAPRVKVGGTQLTAAGLIQFTKVTHVRDIEKISDRAARAAGMKNAEALKTALRKAANRTPTARGGKGGDKIFRIDVAWVGEDERIELRQTLPSDAELVQLKAQLARLDARESGPWTREILEWIRANPRVVSKELATLRQVELLPMKIDIRKLKALGLTISHEVGYELSPRGNAYLNWIAND